MAVKAPWLGPSGPILALIGGSFLARKAAWALSGWADYCVLVNEWAWLRSEVCLLRLEVDLGSVWTQSLDRNGGMVC